MHLQSCSLPLQRLKDKSFVSEVWFLFMMMTSKVVINFHQSVNWFIIILNVSKNEISRYIKYNLVKFEWAFFNNKCIFVIINDELKKHKWLILVVFSLKNSKPFLFLLLPFVNVIWLTIHIIIPLCIRNFKSIVILIIFLFVCHQNLLYVVSIKLSIPII